MTNSDVTIAQERETLRMTDGTYKTIPQYFLKGLMDNYSYYLAMRMKNEFYCHIASSRSSGRI